MFSGGVGGGVGVVVGGGSNHKQDATTTYGAINKEENSDRHDS